MVSRISRFFKSSEDSRGGEYEEGQRLYGLDETWIKQSELTEEKALEETGRNNVRDWDYGDGFVTLVEGENEAVWAVFREKGPEYDEFTLRRKELQ